MIPKSVMDLFMKELYNNPDASKQSHKGLPEEAMAKYVRDHLMMSEYQQDSPYPKQLHHKVFTGKHGGVSLIFINEPF